MQVHDSQGVVVYLYFRVVSGDGFKRKLNIVRAVTADRRRETADCVFGLKSLQQGLGSKHKIHFDRSLRFFGYLVSDSTRRESGGSKGEQIASRPTIAHRQRRPHD